MQIWIEDEPDSRWDTIEGAEADPEATAEGSIENLLERETNPGEYRCVISEDGVEVDSAEATVDYDDPRVTQAGEVEPVGAVEIAERLGVKRNTVDRWRQRDLFPSPRWTVGGRPAWNWADIEAWARDTGRSETPTIQIARTMDDVGRYEAKQIPFVWFDTVNDPSNPGWVLRTWTDGDWYDEALDATNPDNPDAAVAEATTLARVAGLI